MPELRQNYATKQWVIIASERARRPVHYAESAERILTHSRPSYHETCPFCPGNEELDLEVERYPQTERWQTRVVHNKYPALSLNGELHRFADGVHNGMSAVGHHEVVVNHRQHNTTLGLMEDWEVQAVLETLLRRGQAIMDDPRIDQVIVFKNHGQRAGASLTHTHCQIIGLPVVPDAVRRRLMTAEQHYQEQGENPVHRMMLDELERESLLIQTSEHFVAFVLYAALSPFHTWIVPRRRCPSIFQMTADELPDLARLLRDLLGRLYFGLNDPDFNLLFRTAPVSHEYNSHLQWYISMVPRLSTLAGFEMGSGMYINPSLPEESAVFLRSVNLEEAMERYRQLNNLVSKA